MSKNDYTSLDAALIRLIKSGKTQFGMLVDSRLLRGLTAPFVTANSPEWRVIDRRLQALRRAGRIRFSRINGAWEVIAKEVGQ